MNAATQRLIEAITQGDDYKVIAMNTLLCYIEHLQRTKSATIGQIHDVLAISYMNVAEAQAETENTHL